jgi:ferredoxin
MVKVDTKKCIGCGYCASVAPDVFEMADDGKSHIKKGAKCKGNECKEAANGCPVKAITV